GIARRGPHGFAAAHTVAAVLIHSQESRTDAPERHPPLPGAGPGRGDSGGVPMARGGGGGWRAAGRIRVGLDWTILRRRRTPACMGRVYRPPVTCIPLHVQKAPCAEHLHTACALVTFVVMRTTK